MKTTEEYYKKAKLILEKEHPGGYFMLTDVALLAHIEAMKDFIEEIPFSFNQFGELKVEVNKPFET